MSAATVHLASCIHGGSSMPAEYKSNSPSPSHLEDHQASKYTIFYAQVVKVIVKLFSSSQQDEFLQQFYFTQCT